MSEGRVGPSSGARTRHAFALSYGVLLFFAFPQPLPGFSDVVDLGMLAAPLAVASLLISLEGLSPRRALLYGFLISLLAHFVFFYWFYVVTVTYGHAQPWLGVLAPLLPSLFVSVFTACFAGCWRALANVRLATPLAAALLWTALDHFRGFALGGFPWATLGYAEHQNTSLLGWVPYTGVYGLSFVVALAGAALARWFCSPAVRGKPPRATVIALASVVLLQGVGALLSHRVGSPENPDRLRVAALQGNIDQREKWSEARVGANLGRYLALSRRAIAARAQVVVWPESAVPGFLEVDPEIREPLRSLVRDHDAVFILGATGAQFDLESGELTQVYDSAFVMGPDGRLADRYDKSKLVPFGEFVPLRGLLGSVFEAMARGMASFDVAQGQGPRAVSFPENLGSTGGIIVGVPICYELLFPDLVRRIAGDGARALFAVTNDAWYGRTGAPYQFLAMTALRSAETGLWTVRAANSGISAIIDSRGKVVRRSEIYVQEVVVGDIPLSPVDWGGTFYTRFGDVFAISCWILSLGMLGASLRRRKTTITEPQIKPPQIMEPQTRNKPR